MKIKWHKGRNETQEKKRQKHVRKKKPASQPGQLYECLNTGRRTQKEEICSRTAKLLTEAEEQRVHAHGVHTEEAMGDEVGSHYQRLGKTNHKHRDLRRVIPDSLIIDY